MKQISYISDFAFRVAVCSLLALSCTREAVEETPDAYTDGALVFRCLDAQTKATEAGDDDYNENVLDHIDVFLYPSGKTDQDAVCHYDIYANTKEGKYSTTVDIDYDKVSELAGTNRRCVAYAIANLPSDKREMIAADGFSTKIESLKKIVLEASFTDGEGGFVNQESFVMDGQTNDIKITKTNSTVATGEIDLSRVASKLTVRVSAQESYTTSTGEWKPLIGEKDSDGKYSNVKVSVVNALNYATVDASPLSAADASVSTSENLFKYAQRVPTAVETDDDATYYRIETPFYSYPYSWEFGSQYETCFKVELLCGKYEDDVLKSSKSFYYKVFLPLTKLERNNWYDFSIDLGVLGSETDEEAVEVEGKYSVVDWNEGTSPSLTIKDVRFLQVSTDGVNNDGQHEIYNKESMEIPYYTSHGCEYKVLKFQQECFYCGEKGAKPDWKDVTFDGTVDLVDGNIVYKHELHNDINKDDVDVAPYRITVRIYHTDAAADYYEDVTIVQYPAIYITAELSNGAVFVNGTGYTWTTTTYYRWSYTCTTTVYKQTRESSGNGGGQGFPGGPEGGNNYTYSWSDDPEEGYPDNHEGTTDWSTVSSKPSSCGEGHSVGTTIIDYYNGLSQARSKDWRTGEYKDEPDRPDGWQYALKTVVEIVWTDQETKTETSHSGSSITAESDNNLGYWDGTAIKSLGSIVDPNKVTGSGDNSNTYLYTVHVTALQEDSEFYIADATETLTSIMGYNTGKIESYRSTIEKSDYDMALSPEYMIASSYGKTEQLAYPQAYARAVGYQEDGYPMGRWRVPTFGEIKLAQRLSDKKKIPSLFDGFYWYASLGEEYHVLDGTQYHKDDFERGGGIRPIYDKWYWGEDPVSSALTTATWSDQISE